MSLQDDLHMEYRISHQCLKDHDFYEGVRAGSGDIFSTDFIIIDNNSMSDGLIYSKEFCCNMYCSHLCCDCKNDTLRQLIVGYNHSFHI